MRRRDEIVLWPVYFDSMKTRSEGRKVPKKLSRPSPNLGVLEKAVANLGFSYKVITDVTYPRFSWKKSGLILVKKTKPKNRIISEVAQEISRLMV